MQIEILIESDLDARMMYLLMRVADRWRALGLDVKTRRLTEPPGSADISFLHVDRSVIGPDLVAPHDRNGPVINARVLDITKRHISKLLCEADDPYDGPVILKSDLNSGGGPERVRTARPDLARRVLRSWRRRLTWRFSRQLGDYEFPVLPNVKAVPGWVWKSESIVVERFVPERDGNFFVTRSWTFLGDRDNVLVKRTRGHVSKAEELVDYTFDESVPPPLRALRETLGFGFGKFDWVIHDGAPILLDANRTPAFYTVTDRHPEMIEALAAGIESLQ